MNNIDRLTNLFSGQKTKDFGFWLTNLFSGHTKGFGFSSSLV